MELAPYFLSGSPPTTNASEAFIRVRVTEGVRPTGYIAVYLPTGTQLIVRGRDLLRFSRGPESSPSTTASNLDDVAELDELIAEQVPHCREGTDAVNGRRPRRSPRPPATRRQPP